MLIRWLIYKIVDLSLPLLTLFCICVPLFHFFSPSILQCFNDLQSNQLQIFIIVRTLNIWLLIRYWALLMSNNIMDNLPKHGDYRAMIMALRMYRILLETFSFHSLWPSDFYGVMRFMYPLSMDQTCFFLTHQWVPLAFHFFLKQKWERPLNLWTLLTSLPKNVHRSSYKIYLKSSSKYIFTPCVPILSHHSSFIFFLFFFLIISL